MNDLVAALRDRISLLEDEKEELEDSLSRIEAKLEAYRDLLKEETGETPPPTRTRKKRGRPKGSKNKKSTSTKSKASSAPEDELWEQAKSSLPQGFSPTTVEEQERARRRFKPMPRTTPNYGVKAGDPEAVFGSKIPKGPRISVEDE